ncbi:MAG: hypothetical protein M4D80_38605 [Myxococcota bacterium]|nr:hypothetical protein [Myxococcota bacterium]
MLRVVLLAVACAGCASVPPAENTNVNSGPELTVYEDGAEISGTGFSMSFAKTGVRLPTSLIHGVEVFGESSCPTPSRAGVSIDPFQTAVGGRLFPSFDQSKNTLDVLMAGPAIVQIAVNYDVPYACAGPQSLRGVATFTLSPSGRIVRTDTVQASTGQMITDAAACTQTCNNMQRAATLEVFWAIRPNGVRSRADDMAIGPLAAADVMLSCAEYEEHTVAIEWSGMGRATEPTLGGPLMYTQTLFDKQSAVSQAMHTSSSTILVAPGRETCSAMAKRMRLPPKLVFDDGTARDVVLDAAGIYSDTTPRTRVELRPLADEAVNDGFAVRLDLDESTHVSVRHRDGSKIKHTVQPDGPNTVIWVEGGIAVSDAVIIEAL